MRTWNHLIPIVYLKAWRDPTIRRPASVWLIDRKTLSSVSKPCKDILAVVDFYLSIDDQGHPTDAIESTLGLAESRFGFIRKQLTLRRTLDVGDRKKLWEFVVGMFLRTLPWRRRINMIGEAAREIVIEEARRHPERTAGRRSSRAERRLLRTSQGRRLLETRLRTIEEVLGTTNTQLVALAQSRWIHSGLDVIRESSIPFCILHANNDIVLASDAPCFLENRHTLAISCDESPGDLWLIPLSPRMVFAGGLGVQEGHFQVGEDWIARFNYRLRGNAEQWLVSWTNNTREGNFVEISGASPTMRENAEEVVRRVIREKRREVLG